MRPKPLVTLLAVLGAAGACAPPAGRAEGASGGEPPPAAKVTVPEGNTPPAKSAPSTPLPLTT